MAPAVFRSLWSDSNIMRLYAIFNIYMIIEILLTMLHDESIINLGFYYPLIIRRKKFASTLYHTIYLPFSPALIAIYWGFIMRCTVIPGFWRFGSLTVAVIVLSIVPAWLRRGCFPTSKNWLWKPCIPAKGCAPISSNDTTNTPMFARLCIESVFGVALTFVLMLASWRGWVWDFGFLNRLLADSDSSSDEKSNKGLGQRKGQEGTSEKKNLAGSLEG